MGKSLAAKTLLHMEIDRKILITYWVNSWIKLQFSWGPLLKDLSRIDSNTLKISNRSEKSAIYTSYNIKWEQNFTNATKLENSLAHKIRRQIAKGNYKKATASYNRLQNIISNNSNNVVIISLSLSLSLTHTHTQ